MEKINIPDRLFFKISEVADITGIKAYVLRYWETEFEIAPAKSKANQRVYERKDIEAILKIKKLLYVDMYTIAGAKKRLREELKKRAQNEEERERDKIKNMENIKIRLRELNQFIQEKAPI